MEAVSEYKKWKNYYIENNLDQSELNKMSSSDIEESFYKHLEFGTGGLRAKIGVGTNRLNMFTISKIALGYGRFLLKEFGNEAKEKGVIIAYDVRYFSKEFAEQTARVLAFLGVKVSIFSKVTTTPELSFAVAHLKSIGGIVITASHNPPEYNGFKIYDNTGGQITLENAEKIIKEINDIDDYLNIQSASNDSKLINTVDDSIYDDFLESIFANLPNKDIYTKIDNDFKILYTPLHGTGKRPIFNAYKKLNFNNIFTIDSQLTEDPEFSTVISPNPEDINAFNLATIESKSLDVNLILGTDPDCDRVGALVKHNGEYVALNGNQIGSLMIYYLLTQKNINKPAYIVKTIVTSNFGVEIANSFGVSHYETLTGFKFIGEKINLINSSSNFIMGYEESYGYLIGKYARDKDGVGSSLLISEMAAYFYNKRLTLIDVLEKLYKEHGYYKEDLLSYTLEGKEGMEKIVSIMTYFRNMDLLYKNSIEVSESLDYLNGVNDLPKSDVIKLIFKDESWLAIRPSGTEPKIKYYLGTKQSTEEDADKKIENMKKLIIKIMNDLL